MSAEFLSLIQNAVGQQAAQSFADSVGVSLNVAVIMLVIILVWDSVWKLISLWKAAQNKSIPSFIVLAIFNTMGILPILYIFIFSKLKKKENKVESKKKIKKKRK